MKARDPKPSNGSMNTIIGEDSSLEGYFEIVGSVKVEGILKGTLIATERLVVGQGGTVLADINVRDAIIGGHFMGNIVAESRVELEANAKVRADLKTRHLIIHEGATFYGSVESGEEPFPLESGDESPAELAVVETHARGRSAPEPPSERSEPAAAPAEQSAVASVEA